jgi:hypothetical protein
MSPMSHSTPHTPEPPVLNEVLPIAVVALGTILLILIGAPIT